MGFLPEDYTKLTRDYTITVDNGSSYAQIPVTIESIKENDNDDGNQDTDPGYTGNDVRSPQTGDNAPLLLFACIMLLGGAITFLYMKVHLRTTSVRFRFRFDKKYKKV